MNSQKKKWIKQKTKSMNKKMLNKIKNWWGNQEINDKVMIAAVSLISIGVMTLKLNNFI